MDIVAITNFLLDKPQFACNPRIQEIEKTFDQLSDEYEKLISAERSRELAYWEKNIEELCAEFPDLVAPNKPLDELAHPDIDPIKLRKTMFMEYFRPVIKSIHKNRNA